MIPEPARTILTDASTRDLADALLAADRVAAGDEESRTLRAWIIDVLSERHPEIRRALDLWLADLAHPATMTQIVLVSLSRLELLEEATS